MQRITVFEDFATYLSNNFKSLFSSAAVDGTSQSVKRFVGIPDRSDVTMDIPSVEAKVTAFYFDKIGLTINKLQHHEKVSYSFTLTLPKYMSNLK
jgi:hypothetical protein